ncbi:MFS transporter [Micromonospora sp. Llam0]|uniref:MFS transporter n=1 Tax=Micromonospora sp. Llam0 TaxID=2485143 RepID=UPI002103DACF|nr:MFS transporter [Micromonospora sp. Llam0]
MASRCVSEPSTRHGSSLWRHRDFMLLWAGQSVGEIGSAVAQLALPLIAVVVLDASAFEVGLLTAATSLAFAVIALPAGALADRHPKRRIMIVCGIARLVIIASVPAAWYVGSLTMGQLYLVAIMAGVCTVFFDVAYQSYLPVLLEPKHLIDGNGKIAATQSLARLAGPSLGGALVGFFGAVWTMTADALSYAVSAALLLGIRHREKHDRSPVEATMRPSLWAETAAGIRFVLGHKIIRKTVACSGTVNLFGSVAGAVQVIFLVRVLNVEPAYTGLIFALAALGGISGAVLSGRTTRWIGSARVMWFSLLVFGLPQILAALAQPGWWVALFPIGFGISYFAIVTYNIAVVTYRQVICPPRLLGRMTAAVRWITWGTIPIGGVIGGALGTVIGIRPTLWIACVGTWAAGFWMYFSPLRRSRDIPSGPKAD